MQGTAPAEAVARANPARPGKALDEAIRCARIAEDNRARDIVVLDLRKATSLVDFFVIATAVTARQGRAIAEEIDAIMKKHGEAKLGIEGSEDGRWILLDYGDFVVHLFSEEARAYYGLTDLWGDAPQLPWEDPSRPRGEAGESGAAPAAE
jgi:ribosome-associated protein